MADETPVSTHADKIPEPPLAAVPARDQSLTDEDDLQQIESVSTNRETEKSAEKPLLSASWFGPASRALLGPAFQVRSRKRGLTALVGGVVLISIAMYRLLSPSTSQGTSGSPQSGPAAPSQSVVNVTHTITAAARVFGAGVALHHPVEAVLLKNGDIVVVDSGNRHVVMLSPAGNVVRTITGGAHPFQEPYAVAASSNGFYVVDTQLRAVEGFDLHGRFQKQVMANAGLDHPRGLARSARGVLYVADPAGNDIVVGASSGAYPSRLVSLTGTSTRTFQQPSDVALAANGNIYVLDNGVSLIRALTPTGTVIDNWAAPGSSTLDSAHILVRPDGGFLVSDPSGSLLLYRPGSHSATRIRLHIPGTAISRLSPLGIAADGPQHVLVTDGTGNRILIVSVP